MKQTITTDAGELILLKVPELGSDGECTGFPEKIGKWDWTNCCLIHDDGGADLELFLCVAQEVPAPVVPVVAACVALMICFRPLYMIGQRHRWWR